MRRTVLLVAAAAVLTAPRVSHATVILAADLADLVAGARAIAHGRVVDVRSQWMQAPRRIDSFVTIEVAEYLKGDFGPTVTFIVPGGEVGAYRSVMVGAPVFARGDEVVLFLGASGPSMPYVLGLSQGVFRVVTDRQTGRRLVTPPAVLARTAGAEPIVRGDATRRPVPLEAFGREVRALLQQPGGPQPAHRPRPLERRQ